MNINTEYVICFQCGEIFAFADEECSKIHTIENRRKKYGYSGIGGKCPLCLKVGLVATSISDIDQQRIRERDDARHYKVKYDDMEDIAGFQRNEISKLKETVRVLQEEIDRLKQGDLFQELRERDFNTCRVCGSTLPRNWTQGRNREFCSDKCRQKAFRIRKRNEKRNEKTPG